MTTPSQAMKQAREALESCQTGGYCDIDGDFRKTWHFDEKLVEEALAVLQQAEQAAPQGYVMVPSKPDQTMLDAGARAARKYMTETGGNSLEVIYDAMLAAAPPVEQAAQSTTDNCANTPYDEGPFTIAAQPVPVSQEVPEGLRVWFGSMAESNGKANWTATLHRGDMTEGFTIERSEHKDRVRYEADRVRFLLGELSEEPYILDYDSELIEHADDARYAEWEKAEAAAHPAAPAVPQQEPAQRCHYPNCGCMHQGGPGLCPEAADIESEASALEAEGKQEGPTDAELLDWLQTRGATVEIVNFLRAGSAWSFRVGGLYSTTSADLRDAIRTALRATEGE